MDYLDSTSSPELAILRLRKELDIFANLRPAIVFDPLVEASTLKPDVIRGLDIMIVRCARHCTGEQQRGNLPDEAKAWLRYRDLYH